MELILHQVIENLKEIIEKSDDLLIEGGLSELNIVLKKVIDESMANIVGEILSNLDEELRENEQRKIDYEIVNRHEKNIETIFGNVNYERTYYKNKKSGEYKHLLDELINVKPHMRKTLNLEARLINEAIDLSYYKSGQKAVESSVLSSTSTMNSIRNIGSIPNNEVEIKERNKKKKILYIEADEDHVASQNGKPLEPKLVYVHEGYEEVSKYKDSKRRKIKNPRYFSGMYSNSDELWVEVLDYLTKAYDYEYIDKIYISGDAALWIKNGVNWIPKAKYVLDRFHLMKYVKKMTAHLDKSYEKKTWKFIRKNKKQELEVLFKVIKEETKVETKLDSVKDSIRYIKRHFKAILRYYKDDYSGCSAEGHVSHILSDRLSSRPLGWSRVGVDAMSKLRVFAANGGNIFKYVRKKFKESKNKIKERKMIKRISKKVKSKVNDINVEIPVIKRGLKNGSYCAVNSLR